MNVLITLKIGLMSMLNNDIFIFKANFPQCIETLYIEEPKDGYLFL